VNDPPREIAQRFAERVRAASKDDIQFLKSFTHAMLVSLVEVAGKRNGLERRIVELERRKSFEYRGVYDEAEEYEPDDFVTHQGSLWHTDQATRTRPGAPSGPWKLAVKRGRDR
jgi:hypothetical protein